ncbi:MAG: methylisocitrate lyase [Fimbriimonadaceae bacterium]|nr:methylisocitrate lyase [Fimbriimonadaceae bacterium]
MIQAPLPSPGRRLRSMMEDRTVLLPGAYNALTARLAWQCGAVAGYLSGGAMTNAHLGAPDIGLITLDEVAGIAARACQAAPIPLLCDADTGFGEVWNVRRTVLEMERAGLAGIHLEDQVSPKRCGHLDGKQVISTQAMVEKIRAAVEARRDPDFLLIARTDARSLDGLEAAAERAQAYMAAGADVIFPEGLRSLEEFVQFRSRVTGPLLANMTEFGRTPLISVREFAEAGCSLVIFPVSALRVTLGAVEPFYRDLLAQGTQAEWIDRMMTREDLYRLVGYSDYEGAEVTWSQDGTGSSSNSIQAPFSIRLTIPLGSFRPSASSERRAVRLIEPPERIRSGQSGFSRAARPTAMRSAPPAMHSSASSADHSPPTPISGLRPDTVRATKASVGSSRLPSRPFIRKSQSETWRASIPGVEQSRSMRAAVCSQRIPGVSDSSGEKR